MLFALPTAQRLARTAALRFVTRSHGLSEPYAKESDGPEVTGYGFELALRLACLLRKPLTQATLGARQVALLPLRLPFGRTLRVAGHEWQLLLEPAGADGQNAVEWQGEGEGGLVLRLTDATVQQLAQTLQPRQGNYVLPLMPQVEWVVEKTTIKDSTGKVVEVIG